MITSTSFGALPTISQSFTIIYLIHFITDVIKAQPSEPAPTLQNSGVSQEYPAAAVPKGFTDYIPLDLPPGAKAVPNKYTRKLARKKTRSGFGDSSSGLPTVGCPKYFAYQYDKKRGGWYGYLGLPKLPNTVDYTMEINMTINRNVLNSDVIKINLLSTDQEVHDELFLKWIIKFPYQDLLPKLIQIKCNDQVICVDDPEPVPRGGTQVKMWAKSHITIGAQYEDEQIIQAEVAYEPTEELGKPKLRSVISRLLDSVDKLTLASFGMNGGPNTYMAPPYSAGQLGIVTDPYGSSGSIIAPNDTTGFNG